MRLLLTLLLAALPVLAAAQDAVRIRLGTLVSSVTYRHPGILAIQVANVDEMSGGRAELGLGTGWFEAEHRAYGIPFPPKRFDLLEERGINIGKASFATEFGRDLEYYSGLVFQIEVGGDRTSPIAGGGRYDGLLRSVGAKVDVPAVGSAIHTERLLASVRGLA